MKLNLGCGQHLMPGFVNVDKFGTPDVNHDLEIFPWPWETNSVDEVLLSHVLEHLGATTELYFGIIKELYRVCKPNAVIHIRVPHPRHDHFLNDPTHVRAITASSLQLFSQKFNHDCKHLSYANSPLGLYLNVDFEIISVILTLDDTWQSQYDKKMLSKEALQVAVQQLNNVVKEIVIEWKVIK